MLARLVVRLCVSYLLVPPAVGEDPVPGLVALLRPYVEDLLVIKNSYQDIESRSLT